MSDLNPEAIHNLAAELFWRYAEHVGVARANELTIASQGRCIITPDIPDELLAPYGLASLNAAEHQPVIDAICAEAHQFCVAEQNMIGSVYVEDATRGRSPSATGIDTSALNHVPAIRGDTDVEMLGSLCLRHPLPAIVFADRMPERGFIRIDETTTALGYELPMFVALTGIEPIGPHFVLTGYFYIPVPSNAHGDLWSKVIQNSLRVVDRLAIAHPADPIDIRFTWPNTRKGIFSRLFG